MVLGILTAIAACPAIIGTTEAVRQGQKSNSREQHRGQRSNLIVNLPVANSYSPKFDGATVVLRDNKLYVRLTTSRNLGPATAHPFTGYYLPYPRNQNRWKAAGWKGEGMVTTISEDPPILNWVYVDSRTYEVKYGVRTDAEDHFTGPWDCTDVDKRVTFEGWEGFIAVQEDVEEDLWALYFDKDDDGLTGPGMVGLCGRRMLLVQITRKERPKTKEMADDERIERVKYATSKSEQEQENVFLEKKNLGSGKDATFA